MRAPTPGSPPYRPSPGQEKDRIGPSRSPVGTRLQISLILNSTNDASERVRLTGV